ncbi:MAG: trigger factor [Gemmatimonadetes bacterium]|nr:trigger factor [Gemmatimonadota bacterium]
MAAQTTSDLRIDVQETASWSRRLSVTVPQERVQRIRKSVASQITRNVRLPGFRKGSIPTSLVEKQFGPAIEQETMDRVIQETYKEVLETGDFQPITQGVVENVHYHPGEDLTFEVHFEVQPKIEISNVGGFTVQRPATEVTDQDVESVLDRIRTERATVRKLDEGVADYNDEVTVEITDLDAEAGSEEAEARPFRFTLGEGQAIPDIEEAIRTLAPGAEGEFTVRYPEDFPDEELRGQEQRLRIKLQELSRRDLPVMDDEFAKTLGEFESVDALRERIRTDLAAENERRAEAEVRAGLVEQLLEANPFEVPGSMVDRYLGFMTGEAQQDPARAKQRTPEQEERFSQMRQMLRPQAEAALKRMLVVEHLADREGLRATADEVDARVEKLAEEHGISPSDAWIQLEKGGQIQALESEITEEKVFEYLRSQNTVA